MTCPNCRNENPAAAKFCLECGNPLATQRPIEGERRFITVLFADVVGSTEMGERLDPEQVTEIMNGAFAVFNTAVARYGGTVSRLMGDAVLALFGAPVAHEDDAERAVRAALDIQYSARMYGERVKQQYAVDFKVRIGIHSGIAVLAFVGDQLKTEYTAMGDTTNVAARLQSAAEPGTVLVSVETYHLVSATFDTISRGPVEVKGKSTPLDVYEIVGVKDAPAKQRGTAGTGAPIVGRDRELQILRGKLGEVRQGRGEFVTIAGEAGLGKSRLVAELRSEATGASSGQAGPPITWIEGRAISYGLSMTYYPWQQVLRESFGAEPSDDVEALRDKLSTACDRYGVASHQRPYLEAMLGIESAASAQVLMDVGQGDAFVRGLADAVATYCTGMSAGSPVVLVFDDMHWADDPSVELLIQFAGLVKDSPVLTLCVHRPEKTARSYYAAEKIRDQLCERYTELPLEALPPERSQELLEHLLTLQELPAPVADLILQRSEGNPFFLEEVFHALVDSSLLVREDGHWRVRANIGEVTIPDTLAGVLGARIDRLPAETKRILLTASVIGRAFGHRVLEDLCVDEQTPKIEPDLTTLVVEDLIRERTRDPEPEYAFKHALTHDAAYNLLLVRRRKELHSRVGRALERLYPDRLEELAAVLERHFCLAEEWGPCAEYSTQAARRAARVFAQGLALEHYDRAYEALDRLPETPAATMCDVILEWAPFAIKFTAPDVVLERLQRGERLARELDDKRRLAKTLVWIANVHFLTGFRSKGMPALVEGYQLAEEIDDEQSTVLPFFIMTSLLVDNDPGGSIGQIEDVVELARKYRSYEVAAHALAMKAMAHARIGEFEQAEQDIQETLAMLDLVSSPVIVGDVELGLAEAYFEMGQTEKALDYGHRGVEKAFQAQGMECACHGFLMQGVMYLRNQSTIEALHALGQAMELTQFTGLDELKNMVRATFAIARTMAGNSEAIPDIERGLANARTIGDNFSAAFIAQALAGIYLEQNRIEEAEPLFDAALDYYRSRGMRPYIAPPLRSLAVIYERTGRADAAAAARDEATQVEAALGPLGADPSATAMTPA